MSWIIRTCPVCDKETKILTRGKTKEIILEFCPTGCFRYINEFKTPRHIKEREAMV